MQLEKIDAISKLIDDIIQTTKTSGEDIENFLKNYTTNTNKYSEADFKELQRQLIQARDSIKMLISEQRPNTPTIPTPIIPNNTLDNRDDTIKRLNEIINEKNMIIEHLEKKNEELKKQLAKHIVSDIELSPLSTNKRSKNILACQISLKVDWVACEKTSTTFYFRIQQVVGATRVNGELVKSDSTYNYPMDKNSLSYTHIASFNKTKNDIEFKTTKFNLLTKGLKEGYYDLDVYMDGEIIGFHNYYFDSKDGGYVIKKEKEKKK